LEARMIWLLAYAGVAIFLLGMACANHRMLWVNVATALLWFPALGLALIILCIELVRGLVQNARDAWLHRRRWRAPE
jgi:hypothetical protein